MNRMPVRGWPAPEPAPGSACFAVAPQPAVTSRAPAAASAAPTLRWSFSLSNIIVPFGLSGRAPADQDGERPRRSDLSWTLAGRATRCLLSAMVDVVVFVVGVTVAVSVTGGTRMCHGPGFAGSRQRGRTGRWHACVV